MNIKTIITTKRLIITILVVSLTANAWYFGNAYFQKWLAEQRTSSYNLGVINNTNAFYEQAKSGRLEIRNFLKKDGQLIIENGELKRGERIMLVPISEVVADEEE